MKNVTYILFYVVFSLFWKVREAFQIIVGLWTDRRTEGHSIVDCSDHARGNCNYSSLQTVTFTNVSLLSYTVTFLIKAVFLIKVT